MSTATVCELVSIKECVNINQDNMVYFDVTISSASEINFSVRAANLDTILFIYELCQVIPSIMKYDMTMMQIADGVRNLKIEPNWVHQIKRFKRLYGDHFLVPLEICDQ
ncbi:hypothetical protein [Gloeothece verrucosa]|uniref:Uncharacterized protein n=1 Tax=Gloeothece verrucosa (strain PCC 7822) TaxID=497965 RepID=E0UCP2_GLOV7|nr:hypothetical protein [Gloeothece verrucosa]ADN14563.1 hypothetical protein Cyan7822_2592 [Gloeothece verrucosa PCC 7822]ADN15236.1 hypothetical protein Cyan7822_3286 [Gloeothece verrucosa PCC 7822]ADN16416.1 hypothetical protein Cyan7822_4506 [Gloeothece verrucosa PCC 7822]